MIEHKSKVENLLKEITSLSNESIQLIYEVDGLCCSAYKVLKSLSVTDRDELILKLPKWTNRQLEVLAFTLHDGNGEGEAIEDNFLLGYVFTLADDSLARDLLNQWLISFFEENNIKSMELLDSIVSRLNILRLNGYIDESTHDWWIKNIRTKKDNL